MVTYFESMKEFSISLLGLRDNMMIKMSILFSFIATCLGSFEQWIWSPFWTIIILWFIIFLDFVTGLGVSMIKNKESFNTSKGLKTILIWFTYNSILGLAFNFAKINELFGIKEVTPFLNVFPRLLYLYIFSVLFLSVVKNATLLGLIKGKIGDFICKYIDTYKNKLEDKIDN